MREIAQSEKPGISLNSVASHVSLKSQFDHQIKKDESHISKHKLYVHDLKKVVVPDFEEMTRKKRNGELKEMLDKSEIIVFSDNKH